MHEERKRYEQEIIAAQTPKIEQDIDPKKELAEKESVSEPLSGEQGEERGLLLP